MMTSFLRVEPIVVTLSESRHAQRLDRELKKVVSCSVVASTFPSSFTYTIRNSNNRFSVLQGSGAITNFTLPVGAFGAEELESLLQSKLGTLGIQCRFVHGSRKFLFTSNTSFSFFFDTVDQGNGSILGFLVGSTNNSMLRDDGTYMLMSSQSVYLKSPQIIILTVRNQSGYLLFEDILHRADTPEWTRQKKRTISFPCNVTSLDVSIQDEFRSAIDVNQMWSLAFHFEYECTNIATKNIFR